jgi:hypothetical protein
MVNIYKMSLYKMSLYKMSLYKIGLYELIILFIVLFFTYTMPLTVYKFTSSFFGKLVSLLSVIYASYFNIAYGVILAVLFLGISEIGYLEGFTKPPLTSKEAFIKENCSANKTTFSLNTIDKDYPNLVFTDGVCEPCDPTCRYNISSTADTLYHFDEKIKPTDEIYLENFESAILSNLKGKYKKNKRKAAMIKDGFTSKVVDKVTHFARKYNL